MAVIHLTGTDPKEKMGMLAAAEVVDWALGLGVKPTDLPGILRGVTITKGEDAWDFKLQVPIEIKGLTIEVVVS